jgi:hypothetical protein
MKHGQLVGGTLLCILGVALGLYVGLWWAFIGGIVQVIEEIRAPELSALGVAIGVIKVMFAGFVGLISALCFVMPGATMIKNA